MTNPKEALEWYKTHGDKQDPKTISEIRAEIENVFGHFSSDVRDWIRKQTGDPNYFGEGYTADCKTATQMLVDWAYEAGKSTGYQNGWDFGYTEGVEASENYKRGFEAGKADAFPTAEEASQLSIEANAEACKDYQRGYEAAAKDPKAWWVPDKNGEEVHIWDKVKYLDEVLTVFAINGDWIVPDESFKTVQADMCEKVIPDSWESLRDDIVEQLYVSVPMKNDQPYKEKANEFIARAKKLAEESQ